MTRSSPPFPPDRSAPSLLAALLLFAAPACHGQDGGWTTAPEFSTSARRLSMDTVLSENHSGVTARTRLLIDGQSEWERFWARVHEGRDPAPAPPAIDFDRNVVVAAAMGETSSGGHAIGVEAVARSGDTLYARIVETSPGDDCVVTAALTHPVQAVRVPVSGVNTLITVERSETHTCG